MHGPFLDNWEIAVQRRAPKREISKLPFRSKRALLPSSRHIPVSEDAWTELAVKTPRFSELSKNEKVKVFGYVVDPDGPCRYLLGKLITCGGGASSCP